jgi:diadenosine tetraphosphate (Ap4A) HIT family hydrolase
MYMLLFENEYFIVSQCKNCDVPGYLILECKDHAKILSDLPMAAQRELGALLGCLESSIVKTLKIEQVYCCKFGEAGGNLHFHLFPRSSSITSDFLDYYPNQKELIHGPILFDWAREYYKVEDGIFSKETVSSFCGIKAHLNKA